MLGRTAKYAQGSFAQGDGHGGGKTFLKELVGFFLERPCGSVAITAGPERPEQVEWPLPQGAKWPLPKDEWWQAGRTEQSTAQYSQAPIL